MGVAVEGEDGGEVGGVDCGRMMVMVRMGMIRLVRMEPIPAHTNTICFDYQIWFGNPYQYQPVSNLVWQ